MTSEERQIRIDSILEKFKDGNERFRNIALVNRVVETLIRDVDEIVIIDQLLDIIHQQEETILKLTMKAQRIGIISHDAGSEIARTTIEMIGRRMPDHVLILDEDLRIPERMDLKITAPLLLDDEVKLRYQMPVRKSDNQPWKKKWKR